MITRPDVNVAGKCACGLPKTTKNYLGPQETLRGFIHLYNCACGSTYVNVAPESLPQDGACIGTCTRRSQSESQNQDQNQNLRKQSGNPY